MVLGIVFVLISIIAFYIVLKTDYEDITVEYEPRGRFKIYLGIIILFILGVISLVKSIT
ncbi:hypothetical protein AAON49_04365 [Pseudotenacibaculum sp. MALMAid0570]|uniref:hypothetical protein n=1 Tax=Pseudotenacibaculum sp. MALMAid0570 TaxID=3143938 RepID=UPI0032DEDE2D